MFLLGLVFGSLQQCSFLPYWENSEFKRARTKSSHSRVLLTNRLIPLKCKLSLGDRSVSLKISQVQKDLKSLLLADLEGSKVRSRVLWLEEGEKATRFFFSLRGNGHRRIQSLLLMMRMVSNSFRAKRFNVLMQRFILSFFPRNLSLSVINRCVLIILAQLFHQIKGIPARVSLLYLNLPALLIA